MCAYKGPLIESYRCHRDLSVLRKSLGINTVSSPLSMVTGTWLAWMRTIQQWFTILIYVIGFNPLSPSNIEPELPQWLILVTFSFILADNLPTKML